MAFLNVLIMLCVVSKSCATGSKDMNVSPYHLKPLGAHIDPVPVDEVSNDNMITPKDFLEKYVFPRKPLIFRGIGKDWPAFTKWTDDYLRGNYANLELRMEGRKEKQSKTPQGDICLGRDSLGHFINTYHQSDVNKYVVSELPTPLYKYVKIPPPMGCGDLSRSFVEIDMWINSGGARSILHKDAFNTINCVVNGSKEWKLVELKYNDLIYQAWEGPQDAGYGGYSLINPEKVDLNKFPKIATIPKWQYAHIKAGDCLHLPSQMWHVVHSHGDQNLAVAFLFSQFFEQEVADVKLEECGDKPNPVPLDQVDPDWKYPGYGKMTMGNSMLVDYAKRINFFFNKTTGRLSKRGMFRAIIMSLEGLPFRREIAKNRTLELFAKINKMAPGGVFTFNMVKNLTRDQLREIIDPYVEPPVPANSCDHEYSHFTPIQIRKLLEEIAEQNKGVISKENFIKAYLDMEGHIKIAEEFWSNYGGDKKEIMFKGSEDKFQTASRKFEINMMEDEEEEVDPNARLNLVGGFKSEERRTRPDFKDEDKEKKEEEEELKHSKSENAAREKEEL